MKKKMLIALSIMSLFCVAYYAKDSDLQPSGIEGTHFKANFTQWQRIYYKILSRNTKMAGGTSIDFKDDTHFEFHFCSPGSYTGTYKRLGDTIFIEAIRIPFPKTFYFKTPKNLLGEMTDTLSKKRYIYSFIKQ